MLEFGILLWVQSNTFGVNKRCLEGDDQDDAAATRRPHASTSTWTERRCAHNSHGGGRVNDFRATVTDIREESRTGGRQRWQMALDRTQFGPGTVGELHAVARSGARLVVPVLGTVVDAAGEVWHVVEKPLAAGTTVTGHVRSE
jgi:hypothetical protein